MKRERQRQMEKEKIKMFEIYDNEAKFKRVGRGRQTETEKKTTSKMFEIF